VLLRHVTEETTRNCLRCSGVRTGGEQVAETTTAAADNDDDDDGDGDDVSLSERVRKYHSDILAPEGLDAYVSTDGDDGTVETQTD
jgi:hypothetical protein